MTVLQDKSIVYVRRFQRMARFESSFVEWFDDVKVEYGLGLTLYFEIVQFMLNCTKENLVGIKQIIYMNI